MITPRDIIKLNEIFATKKELNDVKIELKAEMIALNVALKKDLHDMANRIINEVHNTVRSFAIQVDTNEKEIAGHRVAIGKLEHRVQKLEHTI